MRLRIRRTIPLPGPFYLAPSHRRRGEPNFLLWFFVVAFVVGLAYLIF